ncbi:hypothetical protein ABI59_09730 [Acidobacteria bacterium Mor1]|nr:hypothetical protein ABI59_09730 [Acidobacteria bacterium Mor1]
MHSPTKNPKNSALKALFNFLPVIPRRPAPAAAVRSAAWLLLLALLPAPAVVAQTNVSGTISVDTTWDLAGSPYIVTNNVSVFGTDGPDGVTTLTIDPGVEVRFSNVNAELRAGNFSNDGAIVADGNNGPGAPAQIVFTSDQPAPAPGDWRRIIFDGATGSSVLRNVLIEYAGRNSFDGGVVDVSHGSGTVTMDQLTIRQSNFDGIRVATGAFSLANCTIEDATEFSVQVDNSTTIVGTVSDCNLESLLYNFGALADVTWTNNTFTNWGAATSRMAAGDLDGFLNNNTIASSAPDAAVELLANTNIEEDATWSTTAGTIRLLGNMAVRGTDGPDGVTTLRIDPGARIEMPNFGTITVASFTVPGALIADGDNGPGAPAEILFTSSSATPARGDWRRIYLDRMTDPTSLMRNVRIEYAGQFANDAGLHLFNSSGPIVLDDLTIVESAQYGLRLQGDFDLSNCTIRDHDLSAVRLEPQTGMVGTVSDCTLGSVEYIGQQPMVDWSGNNFVDWGAPASVFAPDGVASLTTGGNTFSTPNLGVDVLAGEVPRSGSWSPSVGPIRMQGALTVAGSGDPTVTFLPGLRVEMPALQRINVGKSIFPLQPGTLIAEGTQVDPIVLTSVAGSPAPGDWEGVFVTNQAGSATRFRDVVIEYHGEGSSDAGLVLSPQSFSVPLERVTIRHGANDGIRANFGALDLRDSLIQDVAGYSVWLADNNSVAGTVSGSTLESVFYDGINPLTSWDGNVFDNWGATPSLVISTVVEDFTNNNTFINPVPDAVLEVSPTRIELDSTWGPGAGPIVLQGSQSIGGTDGPDGVTTLTLDPGTEVRLPAASQFFVGSTNVGRLVADGRVGDGTVDPVLITSAETMPAAGQTQGVQLLGLGELELYETTIEYADAAVQASGEVTAIDGLTVRNSNIGLFLTGSGTVTSTLRRMFFESVDTGVRSTNMFVTIRESNLVGATFGVENTSPAAFCVDASENWWGSADGPSGSAPTQGCELDVPPGAGSALTEGVQFDNFLTEPVDPAGSVNVLVANLRFSTNDTLIWDPALGAVEYHIYRQPLSSVGAAPYAVCRDDLDGDRTDEQLIDLEEPLLPGEGLTYLVTGENSSGTEGAFGDATAGPRSALNICP